MFHQTIHYEETFSRKVFSTVKKLPFLLGCIADDFTGASDAASFLVNQGVPTMLFNGIPAGTDSLECCAAVVIALKTRSIAVEDAVRDTLDAAEFLEKHKARQLYIKYCSTFDSTPKGNIGPTIDALMDKYNIPYTLLCPALPVNKRIVKGGVLYVDDIPLSEGHMRNHPLNPMWDSNLAVLMQPQGKYPCLVLNAEQMSRPVHDLNELAQNAARDGKHCYIIPDYADDADGQRIVEVFGDIRLLTGGSGILAPLAQRYVKEYDLEGLNIIDSKCAGKGIALSGSCSNATKEQIKVYRESGGTTLSIDPVKLLDGSQTIDSIWEFVQANNEPLIHSEQDAKRVEDSKGTAAKALEKAFSEIGRRAFDAGYTRIIVAGGETSGAVTLELNFDSFLIGESIAPGVPVMAPAKRQDIRIVLKSGNFGQPDFFRRAFEQTNSGN